MESTKKSYCKGRQLHHRQRVVLVAAAHLNMALLIGLVRCGGVYYHSWKSEFEVTAKETTAIQSIMMSLASFSIMIGGILTKRFGCRVSGIIGGTLTSCGLLAGYFVRSIQQLYVTAAISGIGVGIAYNAGIVVIAQHFKTHFKTANAITLAGCGTGVMAAPPLFQYLQDQYGWRGAMLVSCAIMSNVVALCALFRPPRSQFRCFQDTRDDGAKDITSNLDDEVDKLQFGNNLNNERDAQMRVSGHFARDLKKHSPVCRLFRTVFSALGLDILLKKYRLMMLYLVDIESSFPYFGFVQLIVPRAESIDIVPSSAVLLLSLFGVGLLSGRLCSGVLIGWKLSPDQVAAIGMTLGGIFLLVGNVDSFVFLAISSFVQGGVIGVFVAINVVMTRSYVGVTNMAVYIGIHGVCFAIGVLVGPIMAGWLLDITSSYKTVFYALSGVYFLCALELLSFPLLKRLEPGLQMDDQHSIER